MNPQVLPTTLTEAMQSGAYGLLRKPFDSKELIAEIKRITNDAYELAEAATAPGWFPAPALPTRVARCDHPAMIDRLTAVFVVALAVSACASRRPSALEGRLSDGPVVLVKECRIPAWEPWYARFAVHTWIDQRSADGRWTRIGIPGTTSDVVRRELEPAEALADERWERRVRVVDVLTGEAAARALEGLAEAEASWMDGSYTAFPGPNSNTFIERVARATPGFAPQLSPNAVGRDHAGLRAGVTGSGTGIELETAWLGAEVGLREGAQLHVAQFPVGVRLWPPALLLPFLPALGPSLEP